MFVKKNLFMFLMGLGCCSFLTSAQALAASEAILVKIHDIQTVKNDKGVTTACEFATTVYNRTSSDINELIFDLNWFDEAVDGVINQEKSSNTNNRRGTKDFVTAEVHNPVNIPQLKKNTQKTIRAKINTDRCFMLLEDAKINVSSCKSGVQKRNDAVTCEGMLQYVSSTSPEYYTDFLAITLDEKKEEEAKTKEKVSQELDSIIEMTEENLQKTSRVLATTYAPLNPQGANAISKPSAVKTPSVETAGVVKPNNAQKEVATQEAAAQDKDAKTENANK